MAGDVMAYVMVVVLSVAGLLYVGAAVGRSRASPPGRSGRGRPASSLRSGRGRPASFLRSGRGRPASSLRSGRRPASERRDELVSRKQAALTAILDLEDERALGKLSEDDFGALVASYEAEAAAALRALDELGLEDPDPLEREIAAARARLEPSLRSGRGRPASFLRSGRGRPASFLRSGRGRPAACPSCGAPASPEGPCSRCGA
jgi:hypothetical protein